MNANNLLQTVLFIVVLLAAAVPVARYLSAVMDGSSRVVRVFGPLERALYRIAGVDAGTEMNWGWSEVPVIVLSARTQEEEKVAALDAGADDYLTKPFGVSELRARMRAQLRRRNQGGANESPKVSFGTVTVDLALRQVWRDDAIVHLTPLEYRLLATLVRHAGRVLTHRQLLRDVWGPSHVESHHYLRIYMAHLRQKLEADPAQPEHI
ncbi:winged helix-turn-helix domain-containing protein, partial [Burkholderia sola]|nr:winged helix-turn-helix domain-containing protein [Burkholderia sola]